MKALTLSLILILVAACTTKVKIDPAFYEGGFEELPSSYEPPEGKILPDYFNAAYNGEHIIRKGDMLEIMVIGQNDTEIEVPVSPDGYLYYLMAKPVYAAGLKISDLRSKLETDLNSFFEDPKIYIRVLKSTMPHTMANT